jgi:hypothetical protein
MHSRSVTLGHLCDNNPVWLRRDVVRECTVRAIGSEHNYSVKIHEIPCVRLARVCGQHEIV